MHSWRPGLAAMQRDGQKITSGPRRRCQPRASVSFQDLPPDHAKQLKDLLRLPDEVLEPMFEALQRWGVSPDVAANLDGLMIEAEIQEALPLLKAEVWPLGQHVDGDLEEDDSSVTGIEDRYHRLLVGPCDPGLAESEAECALVDEIGVGSEDDFDCSYKEWVEPLREEVLTAAELARADHLEQRPQHAAVIHNTVEDTVRQGRVSLEQRMSAKPANQCKISRYIAGLPIDNDVEPRLLTGV